MAKIDMQKIIEDAQAAIHEEHEGHKKAAGKHDLAKREHFTEIPHDAGVEPSPPPPKHKPIRTWANKKLG